MTVGARVDPDECRCERVGGGLCKNDCRWECECLSVACMCAVFYFLPM